MDENILSFFDESEKSVPEQFLYNVVSMKDFFEETRLEDTVNNWIASTKFMLEAFKRYAIRKERNDVIETIEELLAEMKWGVLNYND